MDISRLRPTTSLTASPLRLTASFLLLTAGAGFAGTSCANGDYRNAGVITVMSVGVAFLLTAPVAVEAVLLTWFATTPLASFYIRYPLDRSIITYNRVVFGVLVLMLVFKGLAQVNTTASLLEDSLLTKFEIAWALLSVLALMSAAVKSNNAAYAMRIAVDTFWLPLFSFYFARRSFDLRSGGRFLFFGCAALALFLFATGVFELATGIDLFQYKGAELVREGERRVNGPFAADSSFAMICLMLFLFLQAAPGLLSARFDRSARLVYVVATVAAALGSLLSMFRIVAFTLLICGIAQSWYFRSVSDGSLLKRSDIRRALPLAALAGAVLIALGLSLAMMAPSIFGGRLASPRSAFGRLATWQAALEISFENPVIGVGLTNYGDYFDASHYYSDEPLEEVGETKAVDSPHSNTLWIASELGLPGLALYIAANLYLFFMGWRALNRAGDRRQQLAAFCFLTLLIAYSIPGLTLSSAYYSDLNLYFFFLIGALSNRFPGMTSIRADHETLLESE